MKCIKYTLFLFNLLFTVSFNIKYFLILSKYFSVVRTVSDRDWWSGAGSLQSVSWLPRRPVLLHPCLPRHCWLHHLLRGFLRMLRRHQRKPLHDLHLRCAAGNHLSDGDRSWYCCLQTQVWGCYEIENVEYAKLILCLSFPRWNNCWRPTWRRECWTTTRLDTMESPTPGTSSRLRSVENIFKNFNRWDLLCLSMRVSWTNIV